MSINFPNSPSVNDTHTAANKTWTWNGQSWLASNGNQGSQGSQGFQGFQGFQGSQGATGLQGFQGSQGATGLQGFQGSQGFQGATYVHPSDGVDPGAALTGANVFSDITVNTAGHVTGSATRALTAGNIGAATSGHTHAGVYEPVFTKNTGFNKDYGAAAGTVSEGNHAHAGVYVDLALPNIDGAVAIDMNVKTAAPTNTITLADDDITTYIPVSQNSATIALTVPAGTFRSKTNYRISGAVLVMTTEAYTGLTVTTTATTSDITGTAPTATNERKILAYQFFKTSTQSHLVARWI